MKIGALVVNLTLAVSLISGGVQTAHASLYFHTFDNGAKVCTRLTPAGLGLNRFLAQRFESPKWLKIRDHLRRAPRGHPWYLADGGTSIQVQSRRITVHTLDGTYSERRVSRREWRSRGCPHW